VREKGVLAWVRDRDELCLRPSYQGVRGGVDLPAWVREEGERLPVGPFVPAGISFLAIDSSLFISLFHFLIRFLVVPFSFCLLRTVSLQALESGFRLHPSVLHIALFLRVALTRLVLHCSLFSFFPPLPFSAISARLPGHRYLPMIVCVKP
jgi:hypothetical protein